jgi:hypothetical protein
MKALELDLLRNPGNERAVAALEKARKELSWFEAKIQAGDDPGPMVL